MQEYLASAFFIALAVLFLIMLYVAQRKQARMDAVRYKHYRRQSMLQLAKEQEASTAQGGFQVLYERRADEERRVTDDRHHYPLTEVGVERRQNAGRRREDFA